MATDPQSEDWHEAAAGHRQEQFSGKVQRLGKQARRGNRLAGGCLMVFGFLGFIFAILWLLSITEPKSLTPRQIIYLFGGSVLTVASGFAVWRGTFR